MLLSETVRGLLLENHTMDILNIVGASPFLSCEGRGTYYLWWRQETMIVIMIFVLNTLAVSVRMLAMAQSGE